MKTTIPLTCAALGLVLGGCAAPPKDYTAFRQHQPRTILVLPPINQSTEPNATYSVYTTATRPLAELGYYVPPVVIVDRFLKENGLPGPDEMHQAPLDKLREVFGADAVLYITIEKYGTKYVLIDSYTTVWASGRLVDTATGALLWEGIARYEDSGSNSSQPIAALIGAVIDQVVDKMTDKAHLVAAGATSMLLTTPGQGLLRGPRHPEFGKE
jgi:hypothetical protein